MPSGQYWIELDRELKGEPSTYYLLIGHLGCRTKRCFKIGENMKMIDEGTIGGLAITTTCSLCGGCVIVQLFRAKDIPEDWSYGIPLQMDAGITVKDDNEMMPFGG